MANTSHYEQTSRSANSSALRSAKSRSPAERRGFTTISTPRGTSGHAVRSISLTRRRILFLLTAMPTFRGVVNPTRLWSSPLASTKTTKERESLLAPLLYTDWNSAEFLSLINPGDLLVVLNRNALASLVTPRFQDQPATSRLHPRTKTVRLCTMSVVRLVSSLWHSCGAPKKEFTVASHEEARQFWRSRDSLLPVEMEK